MKVVIKLGLLLFVLSIYSTADAQEDINNEVFTYKFLPNSTGAGIIYTGNSHSFSLNIAGTSVKQQQVQSKGENQNFISVGKNIVQLSLVELPQPIPPAMHLSKLTDKEARETLEGYVNFEINYFVNELKTNPHNIKKEWKVINSRLFLIWHFEFDAKIQGAPNSFSGQIYYSTICFNQVLDLNMPLYHQNEIGKAQTIITNIASTLKTYNKRLPGNK